MNYFKILLETFFILQFCYFSLVKASVIPKTASLRWIVPPGDPTVSAHMTTNGHQCYKLQLIKFLYFNLSVYVLLI